MNLNDVPKNPAWYSTCGWCYQRPGHLKCTCTKACEQKLCPMQEEIDILPRPVPIPTFQKGSS